MIKILKVGKKAHHLSVECDDSAVRIHCFVFFFLAAATVLSLAPFLTA